LHIPDGYLSPSTCVSLLVAATPFWYVGVVRVQKTLRTRTIPLVSVFAAFSFVIMMFNLPLPGGTTGHAVGMGIAAIVLGPWASILALSIALVIQAVLFGDGGITAIGANCFNMAVVGSLASYAIYRLVCYRAAIGSSRRVLGAGIAGYVAINFAALLAAIEFGIQPLLFHDASGAPLYAPYPLSVSIPAMMIGHLTLAGLAEVIISAGVIAYLQKADPALLRQTAPDAPDVDAPFPPTAGTLPWATVRKLWLGLALLLILTPLGILAAGSAWGEWTAHDFSDPQVREQIAGASGNQMPPTQLPRGLERLSSIWTAPLSRYAPLFIRSAGFGYLLSAMVGVGLIVACSLLGSWLLTKVQSEPHANRATASQSSHRHRRRTFIEKTIRSLLESIEHTVFAEDMASSHGLLQRWDPRVKMIGIGALIFAAVSVNRIPVLIAVFLAAVSLAVLSHIPIRILAAKVWIAVAAFTGMIALPAIFLTPGQSVYRFPVLGWQVTQQGLGGATLLMLRAETAATLSALFILCTLWTHVLLALRFFRLPVILVVILGMTYRYMFLFLQIARDMFESRQCRLVGVLEGSDRRRLAAAGAGVLLGKTLQLSGEVHTAMQARGFRGEVRLLDEGKVGWSDWMRGAAIVGIAALALWLGR
jgi:cobalt/nickel transport system permease protein